jgi:outer membrane protein assembly factor BamB
MKESHHYGVCPAVRAGSLVALLSALLLAGCGGGGDADGGGGGGGGPPAPTLTLAAAPTALTAGGSITLTWSSSNATSCTASGDWTGSKATSGNQSIVAAAAGSASFTLICAGQGGSVTRSATVAVSAPQPTTTPTISLTANTGAVTVGSSFTLNWSTTNASSCTASGGWTGARATAGSENFTAVTPGSFTFTLACAGAGGSITQSATVTINSVSQATLTLAAHPASVAVGASFTLGWDSANVTTCTASGAWSGSRATSGSQVFTASAPGTATYTLACNGTNGNISRSATVTITSAPPTEIGQPFIVVTVMGFTPYVQVPELLSAGKSALAYVDVWNQAGTAPVTTATVSINGTPLPYYGSLQAYAAELNVTPGATITASVTVSGIPYVASTRQFDTYPVITTPLENMSWTNSVANEIRWYGTSSRPGAQLLLRMLGPSGQNWPSSNWVNPGAGATSHTVSAGALDALDYVLLVGYADIAIFPGARSGSAFILGGFDHRHVSVRNPPPAPPNVTALTFKTQVPVAVGVNGTKQMAVEATVKCCIFSDWTTKANWSSSNTAVLTVNGAGIVTGVAAGTANVIATYNNVSASMPIRVYQPPPLPASPPIASTAFQVDHTHAGYLTLGTASALPLTNRWSASFQGRVSYPVVADGRVFVVVDRNVPSNGSSIYALDVNTGATLWGPLDHMSAYRWAAHTYANGKLFVITASGLLRAIDAATGAVVWSTQMPGSMGYSAPPVAVNGLVYLSAGAGGQVFAVRQEDGATLWTAPVANGMDSSPTLGSSGLFVSYACDTYRLDPFSGDKLWHYRGACASGGGGMTTVLAGDKLFASVSTGSGNAFTTFNVSDGAIVSGFAPGARPAVAGGTAYFVSSGVLRAVNIATNTTLWTYTADSTLVSAPLVIDNMVAVGSSSGAVYLLDVATGSLLWNGQAAAGVNTTVEGAALVPSGLGAGSGFLLVPGGTTLTGWKMIP